jgi:hypothetical protein
MTITYAGSKRGIPYPAMESWELMAESVQPDFTALSRRRAAFHVSSDQDSSRLLVAFPVAAATTPGNSVRIVVTYVGTDKLGAETTMMITYTMDSSTDGSGSLTIAHDTEVTRIPAYQQQDRSRRIDMPTGSPAVNVQVTTLATGARRQVTEDALVQSMFPQMVVNDVSMTSLLQAVAWAPYAQRFTSHFTRYVVPAMRLRDFRPWDAAHQRALRAAGAATMPRAVPTTYRQAHDGARA